VEHTFSHGLFMVYLDLAELSTVFRDRILWTIEGWGIANFRRRDHHGTTEVDLDDAIRQLVADRTGRRLQGPIRLLTHLAYFGYCFNPVSVYYCFEGDGEQVDTIVAEVNNTPWNEQHCYVLHESEAGDSKVLRRYRFPKQFHVSPFMDMDHQYDWRFTRPGERLHVRMENFQDGRRMFDATMTMARREMTTSTLNKMLVAYPLMTLRVMTAIYWQAARLKMKRVPFFVHPDKREPLDGAVL